MLLKLTANRPKLFLLMKEILKKEYSNYFVSVCYDHKDLWCHFAFLTVLKFILSFNGCESGVQLRHCLKLNVVLNENLEKRRGLSEPIRSPQCHYIVYLFNTGHTITKRTVWTRAKGTNPCKITSVIQLSSNQCNEHLKGDCVSYIYIEYLYRFFHHRNSHLIFHNRDHFLI